MLLGSCSCAVVGCVLCALSGFAAPGGRCGLAPVHVPPSWPAACLPGVLRGPASCAAPRAVWSLSVLQSSFLTLWCLSPPRGLVPPALLGGCAGHAEAGRESGSLCLPLAPAEAGTVGSLRVVPVRGPARGLSLAGLSGAGLRLLALRWLACVDPVTDASGFPYRPGDSAGAPGLFCVRADTSPCGSEDATPGSRAFVVCSSFLAVSGGPASRAPSGAPPLLLHPLCLSTLLGPLRAWVFPALVLCLPSPLPFSFCFAIFFFCFSVLFCLAPPLPLAFLGFRPGCLGPWRFALFVLLASRFLALCALSLSLCCPAVGRLPVVCPPPPSSSVRPRCLWLSLVCGSGCPGPWRCVLFVFIGLPLPGSPCALPSCVSPAWPLAAPWWLPHPRPLPFCVSRFSSLLLGALVFLFYFLFFLCAPPLSLAFSGFRPRVPCTSALCVVCFGGLPLLGSLCALASFVLSAWPLAAPWWLLPPPPPSVSRGFRRCRSVLCAVCCAVLCVPGCVVAPRCCALCCPVLCCHVLCCFVAVVLCPCLLRRALWRCPSPWGTVLGGAVLCGGPPRCVLCAACVLSWPGGACCCLPLCFVLSVSRGAVLCVPCPLRLVRCCASLCWCACVVLFVWCVLLLAPGAVVRCCVLCCFLWCAVVRCWVWWPVVVCWWRVSVSVSLSGRVVCFPVVGVVCCGALLPCVVFCGAVLSRGAVLLCSAVVFWCCWGLLCPPVACRAVLCCAVGWLCCLLPGGGVCVLWSSFPRAVRSLFSPLCALRCLVVLAVVPCFPVSCAVALCHRVVLCCPVLLSFCGAVCVCFALLWPVVRRRAVLCCAVGCVCCFLPSGGVCVLWCPFPPCRHAKKASIILRVTPRWWR